MPQREIITIDEAKCTGCGNCVPGCPEGALQIIDGKARLVSDLFCDGLGACIGDCPEGAISVETREAESYDERRVMENVVKQGKNTIRAHLEHLQTHGETAYFNTAVDFLLEKRYPLDDVLPEKKTKVKCESGGCPGSKPMTFNITSGVKISGSKIPSALTHWPVQMHLLSPASGHFEKSDFVFAADCTAFTIGSFHPEILQGKTLGIACPKLDDGKDRYIEKLVSLIDSAKINTMTVVMMEVPCCGGLLSLVKTAMEQANRKIPLKKLIIGIQGQILSEEWV